MNSTPYQNRPGPRAAAIVRSLQSRLGETGELVYHPDLARAAESAVAGLLLGQLLYWQMSDSTRRYGQDGWFWWLQGQITQRLVITRCEQETARRILRDLGILEECRQGTRNRLHFRIDWQALEEALEKCGVLPHTGFLQSKSPAENPLTDPAAGSECGIQPADFPPAYIRNLEDSDSLEDSRDRARAAAPPSIFVEADSEPVEENKNTPSEPAMAPELPAENSYSPPAPHSPPPSKPEEEIINLDALRFGVRQHIPIAHTDSSCRTSGNLALQPDFCPTPDAKENMNSPSHIPADPALRDRMLGRCLTAVQVSKLLQLRGAAVCAANLDLCEQRGFDHPRLVYACLRDDYAGQNAAAAARTAKRQEHRPPASAGHVGLDLRPCPVNTPDDPLGIPPPEMALQPSWGNSLQPPISEFKVRPPRPDETLAERAEYFGQMRDWIEWKRSSRCTA